MSEAAFRIFGASGTSSFFERVTMDLVRSSSSMLNLSDSLYLSGFFLAMRIIGALGPNVQRAMMWWNGCQATAVAGSVNPKALPT